VANGTCVNVNQVRQTRSGKLLQCRHQPIPADDKETETAPQPIAIPLDNHANQLYIRIMPSLQSYVVRGNHYWRLVESYRDKHGHPRLRVLRHLGTAGKLLQLLSQAPGRPLCAEERDFGATAALWDLAQQLDLQPPL